MKRRPPIWIWIRLVSRIPAVWVSAAIAIAMMFVAVTIPVFFRLLLDYVIPARDLEAFFRTIGLAAVAATMFGLLRATMKHFQSTARDAIELELLARKVDRQVRSSENADWNELQALDGLQKADIRAVAELLGNEPGQFTAGFVQLGVIGGALYVVAGWPMLAVLAIIFVFKVADFILAAREGRWYLQRSVLLTELQEHEASLRESARTLFGLRMAPLQRALFRDVFARNARGFARLRRVQVQNDAMMFVSSEWIYALAFLVGGYQAFHGQISFGIFVFMVTLLLQAQEPLFLVIDACLQVRRFKPMLSLLADRVLERPRPVAPPAIPGGLAAIPELPGRIALSGPSGAGKTTTIENWIGRWQHQSGDVDLVYVPQRIVAFDLGSASYIPGVLGRSAQTLISRFGLTDPVAENRPAKVLSGGELRRLLVARALLLKPAVLVLDEPEAGLDREMRLVMLEILKEYAENFRHSLVIASHDPEFLALCDTKLFIEASHVA